MTAAELTALAERLEANGPRTCGDLDAAARVLRAIAKLEELAAASEIELSSITSMDGFSRKWMATTYILEGTAYGATDIETIENYKGQS